MPLPVLLISAIRLALAFLRRRRAQALAAAAAVPVVMATVVLTATLPAPPARPVLSRPRACAERRLNAALIAGAYSRADAPIHAWLVQLGWET